MTKSIDFQKIIRETIEEYTDYVKSFDTVHEDLKNSPAIYQLAFKDRIKSIFRNGMSREYAATAGGNFYCTGLYSTYNLDSTIRNSYTKSDIYGDVILKMKVSSYDRFFICDKKIAKQVYGDKFHPKDQLEILFADYPEVLEELKKSPYYYDIVQTSSSMTSRNVQGFCMAMGGMHCRCDDNLEKYNIRGFVFLGANDGNVTIVRDFKAIIPLEYSTDRGQTWKKDLFTQNTYNNTIKDHDPITFLGDTAKFYCDPKKCRVINGFMLVQRKTDRKYNLLEEKTKKPLSPIWFDYATVADENGFAMVKSRELTDTDEYFYVNKIGCYENKDDNYPFLFWDEL